MNKIDALNILIEAQEDIIRQLKFDYINNNTDNNTTDVSDINVGDISSRNKDNNYMSLNDVKELEKKIRDIKDMLPAITNNKKLMKIRFMDMYLTLEQPTDIGTYILWSDDNANIPECGIQYKIKYNPAIDLVYSKTDSDNNNNIDLYLYEDPYLEDYTYKYSINEDDIRDSFRVNEEEYLKEEDNKKDGGNDVYYLDI